MVGRLNPNWIVPTAPRGTSDSRAASTAFVTGGGAGPRIVLNAATSFYYDTAAGNDNNPGTSASPWASPAPLGTLYDFANQTVTLNLKNNDTVGFVAPSITGGGRLILDLGAHSISPTGVDAIAVTKTSTAILRVQNGTLSSGAGACIGLSAPALVETATALTFGAAVFGHMTSGQSGIPGLGTVATSPGGSINVLNNYTISGNANRHIMGTDLSSIIFQNITITFAANLTFSDAMFRARKNGEITPQGIQFAGGGHTITGQAYFADTAGGIVGAGSLNQLTAFGASAGNFTAPGWLA